MSLRLSPLKHYNTFDLFYVPESDLSLQDNFPSPTCTSSFRFVRYNALVEKVFNRPICNRDVDTTQSNNLYGTRIISLLTNARMGLDWRNYD